MGVTETTILVRSGTLTRRKGDYIIKCTAACRVRWRCSTHLATKISQRSIANFGTLRASTRTSRLRQMMYVSRLYRPTVLLVLLLAFTTAAPSGWTATAAGDSIVCPDVVLVTMTWEGRRWTGSAHRLTPLGNEYFYVVSDVWGWVLTGYFSFSYWECATKDKPTPRNTTYNPPQPPGHQPPPYPGGT